MGRVLRFSGLWLRLQGTGFQQREKSGHFCGCCCSDRVRLLSTSHQMDSASCHQPGLGFRAFGFERCAWVLGLAFGVGGFTVRGSAVGLDMRTMAVTRYCMCNSLACREFQSAKVTLLLRPQLASVMFFFWCSRAASRAASTSTDSHEPHVSVRAPIPAFRSYDGLHTGSPQTSLEAALPGVSFGLKKLLMARNRTHRMMLTLCCTEPSLAPWQNLAPALHSPGFQPAKASCNLWVAREATGLDGLQENKGSGE